MNGLIGRNPINCPGIYPILFSSIDCRLPRSLGPRRIEMANMMLRTGVYCARCGFTDIPYVRALLLMLMLYFAWSGAAAAEAERTAEIKRIVILHSFGRDFKPWTDYASSIRTELEQQSPWRLEITDHSLVAARFSNENSEAAFVEYLQALFAMKSPNLILSIGAPAASFVQRNRQRLFDRIPMLFTAVEQRNVRTNELTPYDTVVAVAHDFPAAIENILHLLPDTKHVAVVNGSSPLEKFWREEMRKELKPFEGRVTFTWYDSLSFEAILKQASALPPHSAIFWHLMSVDAAGIAHEGGRALRRLHDTVNAPIFSYVDSFFGRDLVGGPMHSVAEGSRQTVSVAMRILGGEKPSDIKTTVVGFATPKFDWRQLQRWGIHEDRLPAGSAVEFRELTAWQRYRWQIEAAALAFLVLLSMTMWLLAERFGRRKAEIQNRSLSLEVVHLNRVAEVGALSASFAHDLGQPLASIALNALFVKDKLSAERPLDKLNEAVGDIVSANAHALDILKHMAGLLKSRACESVQPTDLNDVIVEALRILSTEAQHRKILLEKGCHPGPVFVSVDAIRLLQVLLNLALNAMDAMADTHSGTRRIAIRTAVIGGGDVEVIVEDSGPGIPTEKIDAIFDTFYTTKENGTGMGLSISRTIIDSFGGKIWAENRSKGGAAFVFTLPLSTRGAAQQPAMEPRLVERLAS